MQRIAYKLATYSVAAPAILYWARSLYGIRLPQKDERPHIAALPFGASDDYSFQLVSVQSAYPNR
jgi:hypothetical protein